MSLHDIPALDPGTRSESFVSSYPVADYFGPWGQRGAPAEELGGC